MDMNIFYKILNILKKRENIHKKDKICNIRTEIRNDPLIVVDIGCRWGVAERFFSEEYADKFKIFGFDPDSNECKRLQESYSSFSSDFVTCIPIGLAGTNGKRTLYITIEPACSSLYKPIDFLSENYPALSCIKLRKKITIDVKTLKQWAIENEINSIDYIKIDTQGSELEILKGADDLILSTRCIDLEVEFNPIYKEQALFGEIDTFLRSKGFQIWRISNMVHYSTDNKSKPLSKKITFCFNEDCREEVQSYGGQLFWADVRYIHSDVISKNTECVNQINRDILLFKTLDMTDVVDQINYNKKIIT